MNLKQRLARGAGMFLMQAVLDQTHGGFVFSSLGYVASLRKMILTEVRQSNPKTLAQGVL